MANVVAENDYTPDAFSKLSKWAVYSSGLLLLGGLIAGCTPKPPGPDNGGGDTDNNPDTDSLCPNLLRIAAANSVDVASRLPAWQAADKVELEQDLACFAPEASSLTIGEILTVGQNAGEEVVQVAWSRGGEVIPLLAVPGAQVDDLQLVQFFNPKASQWEALGPDQAQAQLAAVNINSATGDIETESSGAMIKATRDFNKDISFQIVNPDGTATVLSQDQVKNNLALGPWLTQVENLWKGQEMLSFEVVSGVDLSVATAEKFSLPQEVFAAAREKHLAPIETEGSKFAASCTTDSCTVMLTDVLVTGAELQPATDGKVSYGFDGQAGSEALFRFNGLPEGVRATAFVCQEGNPWGFKAGTVVVWFWQGGSKGPATILNVDNPLQIMADKPNSISLTAVDNGLRIIRTGPDGAMIDEQQVAFLPPLPSEFLSQFDGTKYSISENQIFWASDTSHKIQIASIEAGKFVFSVNGQEVAVESGLAVVPEAKWFLNGESEQIMAINDKTGTYWQYEFDLTTNQWVEKNLPEVSVDFYNPTEIEWNDIVSGRWAAAVRQTITAGKIPTFSDQVVVKPGEPNDYLYEKYGVRFLAYKDDEDLYGINPETRPIKYTAFARILLGGQSRLVLTEQFANKSGGFTLISMVLGDNEAWERFLSDSYRSNNAAIVPIVEAKSAKELLRGWKGDGSGYAAWFVENGSGLIETAYKEWLASGKLPPVMEKVLFAPNGFTW